MDVLALIIVAIAVIIICAYFANTKDNHIEGSANFGDTSVRQTNVETAQNVTDRFAKQMADDKLAADGFSPASAPPPPPVQGNKTDSSPSGASKGKKHNHHKHKHHKHKKVSKKSKHKKSSKEGGVDVKVSGQSHAPISVNVPGSAKAPSIAEPS